VTAAVKWSSGSVIVLIAGGLVASVLGAALASWLIRRDLRKLADGN
jgi:uncharacterized membrane protein YfcA